MCSLNTTNLSTGFGSFNEGVTEPESEVPYSDSLLQSLGVKAHNCGVFWANGTSMEPTIYDGDTNVSGFQQKRGSWRR